MSTSFKTTLGPMQAADSLVLFVLSSIRIPSTNGSQATVQALKCFFSLNIQWRLKILNSSEQKELVSILISESPDPVSHGGCVLLSDSNNYHLSKRLYKMAHKRPNSNTSSISLQFVKHISHHVLVSTLLWCKLNFKTVS